jgi:hypothetical protein
MNKLKPFIKGLQITDDGLNEYVHNFTIGSYCNSMSKNYDD